MVSDGDNGANDRAGAIAVFGAGIAGNLAIAVAWLTLFRPVVAWLGMIYSRDDFRLNQLLLVGIVLLAASRLPRGGRVEAALAALATAPRLQPAPLILTGIATAAYLYCERFLDINILSGALFGLGSYALLGLWLAPRRWRSGLPVALLIVGTLPFGAHMDTFVGYPARLLTARWVTSILGGVGIAAIDAETILHFETGVAHVDLPCSGVRSLWTGGLLLLAATWIEGRRIGGRWLVAAGFLTGLLMLANMGRVLALVVVGEVWRQPAFAEMLHIPLGVLGFSVASLAGVWLLRWFVPAHAAGEAATSGAGFDAAGLDTAGLDTADLDTAGNAIGSDIAADSASRVNRGSPARRGFPVRAAHSTIVEIKSAKRPFFRIALLAAIAVCAIALNTRQPVAMAGAVDLAWPADLAVSPAPLTTDEVEWLTRDGAEAAERVRFTWHETSGSLIVVTSSTWRGQHLPERCLEVRGLPIDDNAMRLVAPDFPVRRVALGAGTATAVYWFQSRSRVTDDYGERMWADIGSQRERWALITVLFDGNVDLEDSSARELLAALKGAVADHLGAQTSALAFERRADSPPKHGTQCTRDTIAPQLYGG